MAERNPRIIIDYGAGGGELIASLLADRRASTVELAVAYDPAEAVSGRLDSRLSEDSRVFVCHEIDQIDARLDGREPDAIICMGVLEHLPLGERLAFCRFCGQRLADGGRVIIDVPVEVGPALVIKQFGRRVLKRRPRE